MPANEMRWALYLSIDRFSSQVEVDTAKATDLAEATDTGRVKRGVVEVSRVSKVVPSRCNLLMRSGDGFGMSLSLYTESADSTDEGEDGHIDVDVRFGQGVEGREGISDASEVASDESSE